MGRFFVKPRPEVNLRAAKRSRVNPAWPASAAGSPVHGALLGSTVASAPCEQGWRNLPLKAPEDGGGERWVWN
jgi:hypothetical protein